MKRLTLAIGCAVLCAIPAYAQDTTVVVQDPDPATPGIQQTTTTTTTEHSESVSRAHVHGAKPAHPAVHRRPVHTAYHAASIHHDSADTRTTTQTTVTVPPHDSSTVVSEHADGSVTVSTDAPPVEVRPAEQDDGQH
jgi:hypothetical protein